MSKGAFYIPRELVSKFHSSCQAYAVLTKREVRGTLWFAENIKAAAIEKAKAAAKAF